MDRSEAARRLVAMLNERKEGRPYGVDNAEEFQRLFSEYVSQHTRTMMTKDGDCIQIPAPLTEGGFCLYCGHSDKWLTMLEKHLAEKQKKSAAEEELFTSVTCAKAFFRNDLMEGAVAGAYNHNIVARILGLTDKQETSISGNPFTLVVREKTRKILEKKNGK